MKTKTSIFALSFALITSLGFKVGDDIELTSYLNGRTHPNFIEKAFIKKTLKAGTTGSVQEIKRFHSGNYGLKMQVSSGPHTGETYWVYYNKKAPSLKLYDKKKEEIGPEIIENETIEEDKPSAETTEDVPGTRDLEEQALIESIKVPGELKEEVEKITKRQQEDCLPSIELSKSKPEVPEQTRQIRREETKPEIKPEPRQELRPEPRRELARENQQQAEEVRQEELKLSSVDENNYRVTDVTEPFRDRPRTANNYPSCKTVSSYVTCNVNGIPERFTLTNSGPNAIVSTQEYYINRSFEFEFEDRARSEMKLMVVDAPSDRTSATTYNLMMFFPRSVLPSVKEEGNELHVTLPNKEVVKFNRSTKEIIGGVFTEGKMEMDSSRKAKPASVQYTGSGVMIKAVKSGDLPYGDTEINGKPARATTTAVISKKGHKDCKIPSKDLWHNDASLKRVVMKPEYSSDEGLDKLLKSKCGFSIF